MARDRCKEKVHEKRKQKAQKKEERREFFNAQKAVIQKEKGQQQQQQRGPSSNRNEEPRASTSRTTMPMLPPEPRPDALTSGGQNLPIVVDVPPVPVGDVDVIVPHPHPGPSSGQAFLTSGGNPNRVSEPIFVWKPADAETPLEFPPAPRPALVAAVESSSSSSDVGKGHKPGTLRHFFSSEQVKAVRIALGLKEKDMESISLTAAAVTLSRFDLLKKTLGPGTSKVVYGQVVTPLGAAILTSNWEMINFILEKEGTSALVKDGSGSSPLLRAAMCLRWNQSQWHDLWCTLATNEKEATNAFKESNSHGVSLFHAMSVRGWTEILRLAIGQLMGSSSNANQTLVRGLINSPMKDGTTALMLAVKWGQEETVSLLVSFGADPLAEDKVGNTSVCRCLAAQEGPALCSLERKPSSWLTSTSNANRIFRLLLSSIDKTYEGEGGKYAHWDFDLYFQKYLHLVSTTLSQQIHGTVSNLISTEEGTFFVERFHSNGRPIFIFILRHLNGGGELFLKSNFFGKLTNAAGGGTKQSSILPHPDLIYTLTLSWFDVLVYAEDFGGKLWTRFVDAFVKQGAADYCLRIIQKYVSYQPAPGEHPLGTSSSASSLVGKCKSKKSSSNVPSSDDGSHEAGGDRDNDPQNEIYLIPWERDPLPPKRNVALAAFLPLVEVVDALGMDVWFDKNFQALSYCYRLLTPTFGGDSVITTFLSPDHIQRTNKKAAIFHTLFVRNKWNSLYANNNKSNNNQRMRPGGGRNTLGNNNNNVPSGHLEPFLLRPPQALVDEFERNKAKAEKEREQQERLRQAKMASSEALETHEEDKENESPNNPVIHSTQFIKPSLTLGPYQLHPEKTTPEPVEQNSAVKNDAQQQESRRERRRRRRRDMFEESQKRSSRKQGKDKSPQKQKQVSQSAPPPITTTSTTVVPAPPLPPPLPPTISRKDGKEGANVEFEIQVPFPTNIISKGKGTIHIEISASAEELESLEYLASVVCVSPISHFSTSILDLSMMGQWDIFFHPESFTATSMDPFLWMGTREILRFNCLLSHLPILDSYYSLGHLGNKAGKLLLTLIMEMWREALNDLLPGQNNTVPRMLDAEFIQEDAIYTTHMEVLTRYMHRAYCQHMATYSNAFGALVRNDVTRTLYRLPESNCLRPPFSISNSWTLPFTTSPMFYKLQHTSMSDIDHGQLFNAYLDSRPQGPPFIQEPDWTFTGRVSVFSDEVVNVPIAFSRNPTRNHLLFRMSLLLEGVYMEEFQLWGTMDKDGIYRQVPERYLTAALDVFRGEVIQDLMAKTLSHGIAQTLLSGLQPDAVVFSNLPDGGIGVVQHGPPEGYYSEEDDDDDYEDEEEPRDEEPSSSSSKKKEGYVVPINVPGYLPMAVTVDSLEVAEACKDLDFAGFLNSFEDRRQLE